MFPSSNTWLVLSVGAAFLAIVACLWWSHDRWINLPVTDSSVVDRAPALWRWGKVLIDRLVPVLQVAIPNGWAEHLRPLLLRAGLERQLSSWSFLAGWILVLGLLLLVLVVTSAAVSPRIHSWLSLLLLCLAITPYSWLRDLVKRRTARLLRALPFFLDLVTLSVEAGLNLSGALRESTDKLPPGPLRDELNRVLREIRAGRSRAQALQSLSDRLQLMSVSSLVAAINTAEKQGAAVAPILRAQAGQRRAERFSHAEKLAMQAPVKMLLPLVLFIFPSTFVILLFPIAVKLIEEGWFK